MMKFQADVEQKGACSSIVVVNKYNLKYENLWDYILD